MTRISAASPEEFTFRSNDTIPTRTQKLELLRKAFNVTSGMVSTKNLLYTLAINVQGLRAYLPENLSQITIGEIVTVDGEGSVFRYSADDIVLATRDWLAVDPAGSYRSSFRAGMSKDGNTDATLNIGFLVYTADGYYLGYHASTEAEAAWTVADGFDTYEVTATGADIIAEYPSGAYVRSYIEFVGSNGGGIMVYLPRIEDTTLVASAASAVAAAQAAAADALAQAIDAANSSSTAAGYASSAAASASDATGQAAAAAASAVAAQSYRDESQTSATASATSASAAQTSATAAGASASAAETARVAAEAANTSANSAASAASTSAAAASASAAEAYQSTVLNASISGNILNKNPGFDDYPDGSAGSPPEDWDYNLTNVSTIQRIADPNGGYAFTLQGVAGQSNYLGQSRDAFREIKTDGYYIIEADVVLLAGVFTGAGVLFRAFNSALSAQQDHKLTFSTDLDQTGVAPGTGTVGQIYQFRKLVKVTLADAKSFRIWAMNHWSSHGSIAGTNTIEWRHVGVRPATNEEANVSVNAGAIASINGAAAFYEVLVAASGSNNAAVRLKAGSGGSAIDLISNVIKIRNIVDGDIIDAVIVSGGDAIFNGGLNVGSYIRLGSGEGWPVALRSRDFPISDGTVVTFDTDLGNLPMLDFSILGLDALAAGESYNLYADSLTSTGFTARLKIFTVSSTTNYSLTTDTTPGTGPTRQIDKGANPDANSGNYTYKWSYSTHWTLYGLGEGAAAIVTFSIWVKKAGVWQFVQNYQVNLANQSTNATRAGNTTDTFQLGTGVQAFGVSLVSYSGDIDSATLTDFNFVQWTTTTGASTRTATPSGEVGKVTVRPQ